MHFINSYLGIYSKTKQKTITKKSKTNKQTKQNKPKKKKEDGKKKVLSRFWTRYIRVAPTAHSHTGSRGDTFVVRTSKPVENL